MSNSFYIPYGEAPLSGLTRNVMQLAELKQRGDIANQEMLNRKEQLMQGNANLDLDRQAFEFKKQEFFASRPDVRPYGQGDGKDHIGAKMMVKQAGLEGSGIDELLENAKNNGLTVGQLHAQFGSDMTRQKTNKFIESKLMKGAENNPAWEGSPEQQKLMALYEYTNSPEKYQEFVDYAFPDMAAYNAALAAENAKNNRTTEPKLYATAKGYLPAEQAVGVLPYAKPKEVKQSTPAAPREPKPEKDQFTPTQVFAAEKTILNSKADQDITAEMDLFNQNARKPYAYKMETRKVERHLIGNLMGEEETKLRKIRLPMVNGKQVTAKDVADTANARGMSYDEALNAILTLSKGRK